MSKYIVFDMFKDGVRERESTLEITRDNELRVIGVIQHGSVLKFNRTNLEVLIKHLRSELIKGKAGRDHGEFKSRYKII